MGSARFTCTALAACLAMFFQPTVFANESHLAPVTLLEANEEASNTGNSLPILDIDVGGEISVSGNNTVKKPWSSKCFDGKGKVQLVQYVAANRKAIRQNQPFNDAVKERRFSAEELATTVIVNMADAMALTKAIVANKLEKSKIKHQTISFVMDDQGAGLERWGMAKESSAVFVLDASGKILFAKDGPLSKIEIEDTIKLIESQII